MTATARPLLEVRGLSVVHRARGGRPRPALEDVSFDLGAGETLAVVGESGSGKTTLARALVRLIRPSAGSLWFRPPDGPETDLARLEGSALRRVRPHLQIMFQDAMAALDPRWRAGEAAAEPLLALGLSTSRTEALARVRSLAGEAGLDPGLLDRFPHELSGGQRQRVLLVRALAPRPALLVLDEPVSALDVSLRAQVLEVLARLRRAHGTAYLFITHDLAGLRSLADRVAVLHQGRLVEIAPAGALFASPRHPYTQALLASIPIPDPAVQRARRAALPPSDAGGIPGPGCAFAPRCPIAEPRCHAVLPALVPVSPHHAAACHLMACESPGAAG